MPNPGDQLNQGCEEIAHKIIALGLGSRFSTVTVVDSSRDLIQSGLSVISGLNAILRRRVQV
jgi:hypothetical protein